MKYETLKHDGSLPIIGVNTFRPEFEPEATTIELARSTEEEKQSQIARVQEFQTRHQDDAELSINHLKETVTQGGNGFAALMDAVRHCSLGQLTDAFFEVGGQYRRNT